MRENTLVSFCISCEKQKQNKNNIESKYLQNIKTNLIYVEENC
jgi:mannose/fructose/N-acetylgalactosamine-specific phosphotransferase system component IID